jgi:tRNA U34 5-methylaminomethyl-2-thiouridine-forming methyltransferase MnmC
MKLEIIITEDGSHSIFNHDLEEGYHSSYGAINESNHVYMDCGLKYAINSSDAINLLEVGLGTGLNALLSSKFALYQNIKINYKAIEPFPISEEISRALNYPEIESFNQSKEILNLIHQCDWGKLYQPNPMLSFLKIKETLQEVKLESEHFHVVFFDAFAPQIQPELWTEEIFLKIYKAMTTGGILTTYSAKGSVRRNMLSAGFTIERLKGPKGKREILRATK